MEQYLWTQETSPPSPSKTIKIEEETLTLTEHHREIDYLIFRELVLQ